MFLLCTDITTFQVSKYRTPCGCFKTFDGCCLPTGLQNSAEDSTLKWYKELQESAARCAQSFEQLNTSKDTQVSFRGYYSRHRGGFSLHVDSAIRELIA